MTNKLKHETKNFFQPGGFSFEGGLRTRGLLFALVLLGLEVLAELVVRVDRDVTRGAVELS